MALCETVSAEKKVSRNNNQHVISFFFLARERGVQVYCYVGSAARKVKLKEVISLNVTGN